MEEDSEKLVGVMSMRTLVLAHNDTRLGDVMFTDIITVSPDEDEEEVASDISKYDMVALPVVDESGHMLGLVTVDDALDVIEESTETEKTTNLWMKVALAMCGGIMFLALYTAVIMRIMEVG